MTQISIALLLVASLLGCSSSNPATDTSADNGSDQSGPSDSTADLSPDKGREKVPTPIELPAQSITITASSKAAYSFGASGGEGTLRYRVVSGPGTIDSETGLYTAGTRSGTATIEVVDQAGKTAQAVAVNVRLFAGAVQSQAHQPGGAIYFASTDFVHPQWTPGMARIGLSNMAIDLGLDGQRGFELQKGDKLSRGKVFDMTPLDDGSMFVAGQFRYYRGQTANALVKLLRDGRPDPVFRAGFAPDAEVFALLLLGDVLMVGGRFDTYGGKPRNNLVAVDAKTGAFIDSFALGAGFNGSVLTLARDGDSVFVGGSFTHYQDHQRSNLAKIDGRTGALDPAFKPGAMPDGSRVLSLVKAGDGLAVGGAFRKLGDQRVGNLALLDGRSGEVLASFIQRQGFDGVVVKLSLMGDALLVAGAFSRYADVSREGLAKVDAKTGALDQIFDTEGIYGTVRAVAVHEDDVYFGGLALFGRLDGTTGAIDQAMAQRVGFRSGGIAVLRPAGQELLVGGDFTLGVQGRKKARVVKLDAQTLEVTQQLELAADYVSAIQLDGKGGLYLLAGENLKWPRHSLLKRHASTLAQDTSLQLDMTLQGEVKSMLATSRGVYLSLVGQISPVKVTHDGAIDGAFKTATTSGRAFVLANDKLYVGSPEYRTPLGDQLGPVVALDPSTGKLLDSDVGQLASIWGRSGTQILGMTATAQDLYALPNMTELSSLDAIWTAGARIGLKDHLRDQAFAVSRDLLLTYPQHLAYHEDWLYLAGDICSGPGVGQSCETTIARVEADTGSEDEPYRIESNSRVRSLHVGDRYLFVGLSRGLLLVDLQSGKPVGLHPLDAWPTPR